MAKRRVVITGLGVVAPNGIGKDAFWKNLVAGHSAVDYISAFDASAFPCKVAAEVRDFKPEMFMEPKRARVMGRFSQFAVAAARLAVEDAQLPREQLAQTGVCIGTATQGTSDLGESYHRKFLQNGWKSIDAHVGLELTAHAATANVQAELGLCGPSMTIASACCTGIDSIEWGVDRVRSGQLDIVLAGAADAPLSGFLFGMFLANGYLSTWGGHPSKASRPYDALRSGLVLSEGGAVVALEELDHAVNRGANIYGEISGYANVSESWHRRSDERYATALERAIEITLRASSLEALELDYICSHGNSTKLDDQAEARAHRAALGPAAYSIPISSIKSMIGQPFAASGLMQALATVLALKHQVIPPTINYDFPDPECDLDYVPNHARVARIRHALFHAHSLGGHLPGSHSAMVLRKFP